MCQYVNLESTALQVFLFEIFVFNYFIFYVLFEMRVIIYYS